MNNDEVMEALDSLRVITKETHMVVIGSQSLHGKYPNRPDLIMRSREIDVMLVNKSRLGYWISDVVGDGTPFEAERGYYIDHVVPHDGFPVLAEGWQKRVIQKTDVPGCRVDYLSPEDLAIAKLGAGRDKDFVFVAGMLESNLVNMVDIKALVELVPGNGRAKVEASLGHLEATTVARMEADRAADGPMYARKGGVLHPAGSVVYAVSSANTGPEDDSREFTDPFKAATAFMEMPAADRPRIIRMSEKGAQVIAQTSQVGWGSEAQFGKWVGESDPVLRSAYADVIWAKAEGQAKHEQPNDIRAQNALKRDLAARLGMTPQQIVERSGGRPKERGGTIER